MRALLYLLTLTLCCFLKNVNCGNFDEFKLNDAAMFLVGQFHNNEIKTQKDLKEELKKIGVEIGSTTLFNYLNKIEKAGGGSRNYISFDQLKNNSAAMFLVGQFHNNEITNKTELLAKLNEIGLKMGGTSLNEYLKKIKNDGGTPFIQAPKIAQQSSNFTSGNPGSSANASNKGKSTNFSKASNPANWSLSSIKGSESHYDGAMPYQQAPMPDTFMPSQTETHSWDWRGENLQSSDGSLQSMVNPENPRSSLGAMPYQEAPIPDTFMPSQTETHSWDWSGGNLQSNDGSLQSMVNPENPRSSSHYGGAMPYQEAPMPDTFMPSQTETHSWDWRGENLQSSDGSLQSMVNPENPRSSHYGGAMPYQEAPIPDTFMPSQTETHSWDWSGGNLQSNDGSLQSMVNPENPRSSHYGGAMPSQQAPLMPDTFMPSQTETHSWDWSGGNLQNDAETLESMFSTRKPSSSKGKNVTKKGKKPRK